MAAKKILVHKVKPLKVSGQRIKALPFSHLIPNITTLMALCTGLSAIRFALLGRLEYAVIAIVVAAILDGMDGRLARMLGVSSHFGAELDSLSDFVSFGVAPAMIIYLSTIHVLGGFGWAVALFFIICSALRLARFNTSLIDTEPIPDWMKNYFIGVPAPAGAFLALMPFMIRFAIESSYEWISFLSVISLLLSGMLMVSKIPTFSAKGIHVPQSWILPLMLGVGVVITGLINAFWFTFFLIGFVYLLSIFFSWRLFKSRLDKTDS